MDSSTPVMLVLFKTANEMVTNDTRSFAKSWKKSINVDSPRIIVG